MPQIKPSNPIIDWGNPITKGLVYDLPLFESSGRNFGELANKSDALLTSTSGTFPTFSQDQYGRNIYFDGGSTNGLLQSTLKASQTGLAQKSLVTVVSRFGGGAGNYGTVVRLHDGTTTRFGFTNDNADGGWGLRIDISWSGGSVAWSVPYPGDTLPHMYVVTYDSGSTSNVPLVYKDGIEIATTLRTAGPSGSIVDGTTSIMIGNLTQSGNVQTRTWNGKIGLTRLYNRILTPTEVKQLYTDPWCIYQKPRFNIINQITTGLRGLISFGMIPSPT